MGYNKKYDTYWITDIENGKKIGAYRKEQKQKTFDNKSECRMRGYLKDLQKETGIKFKRQCVRGTRIYDFWCYDKGIAVEVDGGYHETTWKKNKDKKYDLYNLEVSGIVVLRVRSWNNGDAYSAMDFIRKSEKRGQRRKNLGLSTGGHLATHTKYDNNFDLMIEDLSFDLLM